MKIYALNITKRVSDDYFSYLLSCVSDEKRNRINSFRSVDDAKRTLYGDILLRYLVCESLNVSNERLIFSKSKYGKPFLTDYAQIYFNISHSGDWVVCAIADGEVGVDIEKIKPISFDIAERFFTDNECYYINSSNDNKDNLFYEIWTKKESYIKWVGKGLSLPLKSFDVLSNELQNMITTFQMHDYVISSCCIDDFTLLDVIEMHWNKNNEVIFDKEQKMFYSTILV